MNLIRWSFIRCKYDFFVILSYVVCRSDFRNVSCSLTRATINRYDFNKESFFSSVQRTRTNMSWLNEIFDPNQPRIVHLNENLISLVLYPSWNTKLLYAVEGLLNLWQFNYTILRSESRSYARTGLRFWFVFPRWNLKDCLYECINHMETWKKTGLIISARSSFIEPDRSFLSSIFHS